MKFQINKFHHGIVSKRYLFCCRGGKNVVVSFKLLEPYMVYELIYNLACVYILEKRTAIKTPSMYCS